MSAMASNHSRSASDETNASSMTYVLDHLLQYPGSYEIPLRTMYTLNCLPRAQPMSRATTPTSNSVSASPVAGSVAWNSTETAAMSFTSQLMSHLSSLPTQPSSLPPTFIINFVSRCFHPMAELVDFPQALTALDYLRDLEIRRRKEMIAAFDRVHIHIDSYESDIDSMAEKFPGIALWVRNVEGKNRKAESYYAQLWLGLRRWIMINELSIQPFNKLNCMGMLNTLLPPVQNQAKPPSPMLDPLTLKEERDGFFNYIRLVQRSGPSILQPIIDLNKGPEDENGWPAIQRIVEKYLRVSMNMIEDCLSTTGPEAFERSFDDTRKGKKTDSGVSFGSERRPSAGSSALDKPLPQPKMNPPSSPKGLSKLERITREFKRMRVKPRPEIEEIVQINQRSAADYVPQPGDSTGKKSLKKARSLASLRFGNNNSSLSLAGKAANDASFDPVKMQRHRLQYEASVKKGGRGQM